MKVARDWRQLVWLWFLLLVFGAQAQAVEYPMRPVRIISDSAPGSAVDLILRTLADRLGQVWGRQVVALNQPGGGGAISARNAADATPDGYTLYMPALSVFLDVPGRAANLPIGLPRDFVPVASVADQPMFIAVSPSLGVSTLPELIALAKKRPGEIAYAVTGVGRLTHLAGEMLQRRADIKLLLVPYSGGPAHAIGDVLGGRIPVIIEGYSGLAASIQSGGIKPIAVGSATRLPEFPDLPTVAETLTDYRAFGWQGLVAPLGTPDAVVRLVSDDVRKVLNQPDVRRQLATQGTYTHPMSPDEVIAFVHDQQRTWNPILQELALGPK
jgi:tripartite-type tricarboxylate transporter receptor subunit TctC